MATISDYFEQAQLSMAAYATGLSRGMFGGGEDSPYQVALVNAGMSQRQAEEFANTYQVVWQSPESDPTGFSFTIFEKAGVKYLAISGSANPLDLNSEVWDDWARTNFADILGNGIAVKQGIALFNYLQRLLTTAGMPALQVEYVAPT